MKKEIRNFVIIAHIDHGKSTLADRFLEVTGTVEKRNMKPQYLDQLDLERERGITIKMAPVRMNYIKDGIQFELNLIDTPGHSDFSYEVSRSLAAVEGAILLVDATQGVQAQTLANYENARRVGLKVIGALNKIDVADEDQMSEATDELCELLEVPSEEILHISAKTGVGTEDLLHAVIERIPAPYTGADVSRALVFDSLYDEHKGVIAFVRIFGGSFKAHDFGVLLMTHTVFPIKDIGTFSPKFMSVPELGDGSIGYIATGIKNPDKLKIGETIALKSTGTKKTEPLEGYKEPKPVVFVSFYPEDANKYDDLKQALDKLRLNDASLHFEPDMSEILGRGFKGGFLGQLHFEITAERLASEFDIQTVHSFPSVAYQILPKGKEWITITNPKDFLDEIEEVKEPMTRIEILTPSEYMGSILNLKEIFRFSNLEIKTIGKKTLITAALPLADLISDLDDKLKSISEGFASLSYEREGWQVADVVKMEILVAGNIVPGLTRILPRAQLDREARTSVERLKKLLPKQQFTQALQVSSGGRIVARETIAAASKDVTGYLYGGDRTRKMKLWKKQQKGKQRLKERGMKNAVKIPASVFKELLKK